MSSKTWTVETLNSVVDKELDDLPKDLQARYLKIVEMIEQLGLENLPAHLLKKLRGPLWEMRLRGRDRIARAIYVTVQEKRVVVVRVFVKKTQKTPVREINLALQRAREVLDDQHPRTA